MPHRLSERPKERWENRDPTRRYDYSNDQPGGSVPSEGSRWHHQASLTFLASESTRLVSTVVLTPPPTPASSSYPYLSAQVSQDQSL